jgi:hypothetical protein
MPTRKPDSPARSVFINCPFDDAYAELLRAIVFAISACGYSPVCALDDDDGGQLRSAKLTKMIATCDLSVHDLSRVELSDGAGTPRFNMPFELGLYLGAKQFGGRRQKRKRMLILAGDRRHWAPSISDLAGVDPAYHNNKPDTAVRAVRDFLHRRPDGGVLPGETALLADYRHFRRDLPAIAVRARQTEDEALRYRNYVTFLRAYLENH